jgi:lysophospholipase L1-like esterase
MTSTWTTAYLAALAAAEDALPFFPPPRRFTGQTVRQRVRLRRGGRAARLALSNEFGRDPLVIDAVLVGNGDLTSTTPALYRGAGKWEIPAGATAISDPIPLAMTVRAATADGAAAGDAAADGAAADGAAAGGELVVDCFVSGTAEAATFLHSAQQTGEVAPGDQLGRPRLADSERFTALYWIARVLVDRPAAGPVIVALGDSITRGDGTTPDLDQRYPDHLQRRLAGAGIGDAVVLNAGIGGNRLLRPVVGPSMTDRFDRDVLGAGQATHVLILAGTNDIALPSMLGGKRPAAGDIIDGLRGLARQADRHGVRPVLGTITPFGGSSIEAFLADGNEDVRLAVNDAVTAQTDWPVVDFAAALADPDDPGRLAAAFDSGDGVHPGDVGARALAAAVDLAVFT